MLFWAYTITLIHDTNDNDNNNDINTSNLFMNVWNLMVRWSMISTKNGMVPASAIVPASANLATEETPGLEFMTSWHHGHTEPVSIAHGVTESYAP